MTVNCPPDKFPGLRDVFHVNQTPHFLQKEEEHQHLSY